MASISASSRRQSPHDPPTSSTTAAPHVEHAISPDRISRSLSAASAARLRGSSAIGQMRQRVAFAGPPTGFVPVRISRQQIGGAGQPASASVTRELPAPFAAPPAAASSLGVLDRLDAHHGVRVGAEHLAAARASRLGAIALTDHVSSFAGWRDANAALDIGQRSPRGCQPGRLCGGWRLCGAVGWRRGWRRRLAHRVTVEQSAPALDIGAVSRRGLLLTARCRERPTGAVDPGAINGSHRG